MIVLYILASLTILQGLYTLAEARRAARYMRASAAAASPDRRQSVAVFCPCKGVDHEFEKNIRSILDQDFLNYTPYFIVESEEDTAFDALRRIGVDHILVAGPSLDCGQKVHNLAYAVKHAGAHEDVYVFCDSDARFPRRWLGELTAKVDSNTICSGYRWYTVDRFHLPTLLRSAWNATALSLLGDHGRNFVWGGSTAIRRETFERLRILEAWRGAVSDDYAITRAAQKAGTRIMFVPSCLIPSHGECSFGQLLEFTTRQIIITRVYHPGLWRIGFLAQTVFNAAFVSLAIAMRSNPAAGALWLAVYFLSASRASIRLSAAGSVLRDSSLSRFAWFYILSSPVVALLYQYNMIRSALTSDIEWRQIHYSLISPNETRVRRSSASAS